MLADLGVSHFCSVFMLKQYAVIMSQLEKSWTGMNKLRAKIVLLSSNLHWEILLVVQKIPGKLNENQTLAFFFFFPH